MEKELIEIVNSVSGSTIARIEYSTNVPTAAKFKAVEIKKTTIASVLLFGTQKSAISAYLRRLKKTALLIESNDKQAVENYVVGDVWHVADSAYSVRKHGEKEDGKRYIFPMFCKPSIVSFTIDGKPATRIEVAEFLTPSAKKALLDDSGMVYNKANDVSHSAIFRTIGMENLSSVKIKKRILTK